MLGFAEAAKSVDSRFISLSAVITEHTAPEISKQILDHISPAKQQLSSILFYPPTLFIDRPDWSHSQWLLQCGLSTHLLTAPPENAAPLCHFHRKSSGRLNLLDSLSHIPQQRVSDVTPHLTKIASHEECCNTPAGRERRQYTILLFSSVLSVVSLPCQATKWGGAGICQRSLAFFSYLEPFCQKSANSGTEITQVWMRSVTCVSTYSYVTSDPMSFM